MDDAELNSRLSRISTIWSVVDRAQKSLDDRSGSALVTLLKRYQGAAYRYLLGAVRNPDVADELFQEFALRLVRGAFQSADPKRGRFRDYLKSALYHLVVDYQRRQRKERRSLSSEFSEPRAPTWDPAQSDDQFVRSWRDEILAGAWTSLGERERAGGQPYFSVLQFRSQHPEASSSEMAAQLNEQLRPAKPFTDTGIRKTLQRARAQFAQSLIDEVAHSLNGPTEDDLEAELIELGLQPYCRSALRQRRSATDEHRS